jgi:membrane-bound lytic murein transglycosylase A
MAAAGIAGLVAWWWRAADPMSAHPIVAAGHRLIPVAFRDIPGFADDRFGPAFTAFLRSCGQARQTRPESFDAVCLRALAAGTAVDDAAARTFFEDEFLPHRVEPSDGAGLVTAYYEPVVPGSRVPTARFREPLYRLPDDLVPVNDANRPEGWDESLSWGRRTEAGLEPFPTRAEIDAGALDGVVEPLAYVEDAVEAFFIHIQGSTRIALPDGSTMRIGFAGKNGWPYTSVGRYMQDNGLVPPQGLSMDGLRAFFREDLARARALMQVNRSYIFFREIAGLDLELGPIGGEGVPLTAGRSVAVDTAFHRYGTPVFVDAAIQTGPERSLEPFRRLMIAQDTGSAIRGPARLDLFWGTGAEAGSVAGGIKAPADVYVLLPRGGRPGD